MEENISMAKTNKIISVVLALVLIFSTCAISAFAWTGTGTQEMRIEATADKTVVQPGDTVNVTVKLYKNGSGTWANTFAGYAISWMYNTSVITPTAVEYGDIYRNFSSIRPIGKIVAASPLTQVKNASTAEEQARYTANGYDAICKIQCVKDASTTYGAQGYWESVDGMTMFTLTLTVADTVSNGDTIQFDMISGLFGKNHTYLASVDTSNGNKATNKYGAAYYDSSDASVTLTVGTPAPAGPVVAKAKSQVKMTATSATTVADEFSFRVISKISDSDWDTYFKNTGVAGATTDYITAVGMVAYKGAAAFDAETAKKVVAGTPAEDYAAASTDYISKVSDTADAEFGAIIKANHSTLKNDVTYMGFVQYVDASGNAQTIFYETAGTAALSTNYNTIVNNYLAAYPFAA